MQILRQSLISLCLPLIPAGVFPAGDSAGSAADSSSTVYPKTQASLRRTVTLTHARDYRPLFYEDHDGSSQGVLVDYWKLWSQKTGIAVQFEPMYWHECIEKVKTGQADIIPGIFYTAERDAFLDYSQAFMEVRTNVYVRNSAGITSTGSLKDHVVGAATGDGAADYMQKYMPDVELKLYDGFDELVHAAARGEVDVFAMDDPTAKYYLERYFAADDFETLSTLYVGKFCAAVKEGDYELLTALNRGIENIHEDEIDLILEQWTEQQGILSMRMKKHILTGFIILVSVLVVAHGVILRFRVRQRTKALEAAQHRYQLLIDNAYEGVGVSQNGRYMFVSPSMTRITGYPSSELMSRDVMDFIHPDDREMVSQRVDQIKAGEEVSTTFSARVITDIGDTRWVQISSVRIEWEGQPAQLEFITDISGLKEAENKLLLFRRLFDGANDGMAIFDSEGNLIERNAANRRMLGFSDQELSDMRKPPWMETADIERVGKDVMNRGVFRGELLAKNKEGKVVPIDLSVFTIRDDDGQIMYIAGIGRDITERREVEEALRYSEARFRSLVENVHDIIFSVTADARFQYLSPQFRDLTGHEVEDFLGKPVEPLFHPDEMKEFSNWFDSHLPETGHTGGVKFQIRHKDGSWKWFLTDASVVRDEKGEPLEVVGVMHDISELQQLLDDLEETNRELRDTQTHLIQSEKMASLGLLVAGIAHEINTPIGAVSSMHDTLVRATDKLSEMLNKKLPEDFEESDRLKKVLNIIDNANNVIQNGTERVTTIVRRLRSFARLDEAELKTVNIHEGIEDTLTLIHHEIKNRIEIVRDFGDLPEIACYPGRLNQVFLNIFNNARQAIQGEGTITVTTYEDNGKIHIGIRDSGIGISEEDARRVFDPGFTTKGVGVGTGLGLSICYQIMEDHKGEIKVSGKPGVGTEFVIVLPKNLEELVEDQNSNNR